MKKIIATLALCLLATSALAQQVDSAPPTPEQVRAAQYEMPTRLAGYSFHSEVEVRAGGEVRRFSHRLVRLDDGQLYANGVSQMSVRVAGVTLRNWDGAPTRPLFYLVWPLSRVEGLGRVGDLWAFRVQPRGPYAFEGTVYTDERGWMVRAEGVWREEGYLPARVRLTFDPRTGFPRSLEGEIEARDKNGRAVAVRYAGAYSDYRKARASEPRVELGDIVP